MSNEQKWFVALLVLAATLGFVVGKLLLAVCIFLILYVTWMFRQLNALERWVRQARKMDLPPNDFDGVWGEIADDVKLLAKRYQKDKVRLQAVVSRVQDMTSALTDGIVVVDKRGNVDWWNKAAHRLFIFHEADRGHRLVNIIRHPSFIKYFESRDYSKPLELDSFRREGQYLEFKIHHFGLGERIVVIRDITRMHRLEQMRKDFVANVSHELRTPLTVIRGYLETLSDSPDMRQSWTKAFDQMQEQSQRMTALISDLIALSRLETDESHQEDDPVPLYPLGQKILTDARAVNGEREQTFEMRGDQDLCIAGNEHELHSAISNLVFNAAKYSPPKSTICIDIQKTPHDIVVSVIDNGEGIDPKHIPRLTERFYRVDDGRSSKTGGTGLGLAIVKHVLLRHEGELKIRSRLGQGSTFSCHFPLSRLIKE